MGAKSLCIPADQPRAITSQKCVHPSCQEKATCYTMFGRSYQTSPKNLDFQQQPKCIKKEKNRPLMLFSFVTSSMMPIGRYFCCFFVFFVVLLLLLVALLFDRSFSSLLMLCLRSTLISLQPFSILFLLCSTSYFSQEFITPSDYQLLLLFIDLASSALNQIKVKIIKKAKNMLYQLDNCI